MGQAGRKKAKPIKNIIIFTDCGDTLVDESRQVFSREIPELVETAELIEGARTELEELKARGFRVALVADGLEKSFDTIIRQHGLETFFEARVISEEVGCHKPDARMFQAAMQRMGLTEEDIPRIVMIGNNLKRDIAGANRMGICSVLLSFSSRYSMTAEAEEEQPDYTVAMPCEILPLMERLERVYIETGAAKKN